MKPWNARANVVRRLQPLAMLGCVAGLALVEPGGVGAQSGIFKTPSPAFLQNYRFRESAGPEIFDAGFLGASVAGDFLGNGADQVLLASNFFTDFSNPATWRRQSLQLMASAKDGTFTEASRLINDAPAFYGAQQILVADYNGDRRPDAYVVAGGIDASPFQGEPNGLVLSTPAGQMTNSPGRVPTPVDFTHSGAVGPINGDGVPHIYVGNICCGEGPYLLINDGKGNFTKDVTRLPPEIANAPATLRGYTASALVDVNGDRYADLVLGVNGETKRNGVAVSSRVYLNDGKGSFAKSAAIELPVGCYDTANQVNTVVLGIKAADLRGTGQMDLIMVNAKLNPYYSESCIQVFINDGTGHFVDKTAQRGLNAFAQATASAAASGVSNAWIPSASVFVQDINGDRYPDILASTPNAEPTAFSVLALNDGKGYFTAMPTSYFPQVGNADSRAATLIPVDMRGDGKFGFVQPYRVFDRTNSVWLQRLATYDLISNLPTPAQTVHVVTANLTSEPTQVGSVEVSGDGCSPGLYSLPKQLEWDVGSQCTVLISTPVTSGTSKWDLVNSTLNADAPSTVNPRRIAVGTADIALKVSYVRSSPASTVSVTIISDPALTGSVTVSGLGCDPGSYVIPRTSKWEVGAQCTVTAATPVVDPSGSRLDFASSTLDGGAPVTANPRTITTGSANSTLTITYVRQGGGLVTIISDPPLTGSVIVSGLGCDPGTYVIPRTSQWRAGAQCTVTAATPVVDPSGARLEFVSSHFDAAAPVIANPRTITPGSADSRLTITYVREGFPAIQNVLHGTTFVDGGLVPGSWAIIKGANLAGTTRIWKDSDFVGLGNKLPTKLDGVEVKVNAVSAAVYYISPTQINFQVPAAPTGTVNIRAFRDGVVSNTVSSGTSSSSPGIFPIAANGKNYPAGVFLDGKYTGDPAISPSFRKARPGDVIQLYTTGLESIDSGTVPAFQNWGSTVVKIGTTLVPSPSYIVGVGMFQINVTVPQSFATQPEGDYPVVVLYNPTGATSPATINSSPPGPIVLPIQH